MNPSARRLFGTTPAGETVEQLTLSNGPLTCKLLTFGATLQSLEAPDRNGRPVDVVLGYDTLEEYRTQDGYLGAVVGRFANRIAGGGFSLNGREYRLAVNNGPNHLHGGLEGFSHKVWQVEELTEGRASLSLVSPDGEEGYPGTLRVWVTYQLEGRALSIRYVAQSDGDTPCNLTNHSYFNLAGQGAGLVLDQELALRAARYTPIDETGIPTGSLEAVAGTPMDLTRPIPIGAHIDEPFYQLVLAGGYDHNYVVDGPVGVLRPAAWARCAATGILMKVQTTLPGVQFYTANFLEAGRRGKRGAVYAPRQGFCLETQYFPNSPNEPNFLSCILRAGARYDHTTRYEFSTVE